MTITEDPSTATPEAPAKEVGSARLRKEDARLITGKTTWRSEERRVGKECR